MGQRLLVLGQLVTIRCLTQSQPRAEEVAVSMTLLALREDLEEVRQALGQIILADHPTKQILRVVQLALETREEIKADGRNKQEEEQAVEALEALV